MNGPTQQRFKTSRSTVFVDRAMNAIISVGGIAIILAVFGIFVFIAKEVVPLFQGATVSQRTGEPIKTGVQSALAFGIDEWGERPFVVSPDGRLLIAQPDGSLEERSLAVENGSGLTSVQWRGDQHRLSLGYADGQIRVMSLTYHRDHLGVEGSAGDIICVLEEVFAISLPGGAVRALAVDDQGKKRLVAAVMEDGRSMVVPVVQKLGLGGRAIGTAKAGDPIILPLSEPPEQILVNGAFDMLITHDGHGLITEMIYQDDAVTVEDTFTPFAGQAVTAMGWLFGAQSLVLTAADGQNIIYSLFYHTGESVRRFGQTKTLPTLDGSVISFVPSTRNKSYLVATADEISLRYATTERVRWQESAPEPVYALALSDKYTTCAMLSKSGDIILYDVHDPHPDGGFSTLFSKIQYEGGNEKEWRWESTGGADDFEPKLSMVPLIWGTMKGTLYAMLFAIPIALFAALYCAEFMHPRFKSVVKPTMELMASLPSVVLGYIAAQTLAPVIEDRVPSVFLMAITLPLVCVLFGSFWARQKAQLRSQIRQGYEWIAIAPIGLAAGFLAWQIGIFIDHSMFITINPETGASVDSWSEWVKAIFASGDHGKIGDFRRWYPQVCGIPYEQRNSLVVGVIMGFAVIPIIFTIAEDALSNVPKALRSASLAMGATRWQTAIRVVLPTASAGIFSGIMIGLGRAIGETMIVVMATGNTAIMTINPFDGMRTLSANIAVELPEAAHSSTLYRTLFFGALLLFALTFIINTVAELLRQHLREKYKTV